MFHCGGCGKEKFRDYCDKCGTSDNTCTNWIRLIDWVIVGGESGRHARACDLADVRHLVDQCHETGVACFVKQLGARPMCGVAPWRVRDSKGGDPAEWPEDLRVQQFPEAIAE